MTDLGTSKVITTTEPTHCYACGCVVARGELIVVTQGRHRGNPYRQRECVVCDELFGVLQTGPSLGVETMAPLSTLCLRGRDGRWTALDTQLMDRVLESASGERESPSAVAHWERLRDRYGCDLRAEAARHVAAHQRAVWR